MRCQSPSEQVSQDRTPESRRHVAFCTHQTLLHGLNRCIRKLLVKEWGQEENASLSVAGQEEGSSSLWRKTWSITWWCLLYIIRGLSHGGKGSKSYALSIFSLGQEKMEEGKRKVISFPWGKSRKPSWTESIRPFLKQGAVTGWLREPHPWEPVTQNLSKTNGWTRKTEMDPPCLSKQTSVHKNSPKQSATQGEAKHGNRPSLRASDRAW